MPFLLRNVTTNFIEPLRSRISRRQLALKQQIGKMNPWPVQIVQFKLFCSQEGMR